MCEALIIGVKRGKVAGRRATEGDKGCDGSNVRGDKRPRPGTKKIKGREMSWRGKY